MYTYTQFGSSNQVYTDAIHRDGPAAGLSSLGVKP